MSWKKVDVVSWLWTIAATVLLLIPLPFGGGTHRWPQFMEDLQNFCHPVLFAWLAHLVFASLRARIPRPSAAPYLWVLAGAAGYGIATELLQGFTGRQTSGLDLMNDVLGAGFALLLHARAEQSAASRRWACLVLAAAAGILIATPLALTSAAYVYRRAAFPVIWKADAPLLKRQSHWQEGRFPGLVLREPRPNWRDYEFLELDIRNARATDLPIVVHVQDRSRIFRYRNSYNGRFTLPARSEVTLRIPMEEVRARPGMRPMRISAIKGMGVFSLAGGAARDVDVREVRLAH